MCEVRTATTEGQYSQVRPEQARLVSCLLYGTLSCLFQFLHQKFPVFQFSLFWLQIWVCRFRSKTKIRRMDRSHGNGPNCKSLTEKEPIRAQGFAEDWVCQPYNKMKYLLAITWWNFLFYPASLWLPRCDFHKPSIYHLCDEPFAQKLSQVAQIFTKQSKRNEGHMMHRHRPTYKLKYSYIWICHMSL